MSVENDVQVYLVAQIATLTAAQIWIGGLPRTPDDAHAILSTGGPPPELAMGPVVIERMVTIQVLTRRREGEHVIAETAAQAIHTELQALGTVTMNGTVYDKVVAASEPFFVSADGNNRVLWSANYEVWRAGA